MEGLEALNYEPLHSVFHREGDRILLDKECLLSLRPEDMYVWFYEMVDAAKKEHCGGIDKGIGMVENRSI